MAIIWWRNKRHGFLIPCWMVKVGIWYLSENWWKLTHDRWSEIQTNLNHKYKLIWSSKTRNENKENNNYWIPTPHQELCWNFFRLSHLMFTAALHKKVISIAYMYYLYVTGLRPSDWYISKLKWEHRSFGLPNFSIQPWLP